MDFLGFIQDIEIARRKLRPIQVAAAQETCNRQRRSGSVDSLGLEERLALCVDGTTSLEKSKMVVTDVFELEVVLTDGQVLDALLFAFSDRI